MTYRNNSKLYYRNSWYLRNVDLNQDSDGNYVPMLLEVGEIPRSQNDLYVQVTSGYEYRLDLISFEIYGTTKLWWAIALANNRYDLFNYPQSGDTVRVPAIQTIQQYI